MELLIEACRFVGLQAQRCENESVLGTFLRVVESKMSCERSVWVPSSKYWAQGKNRHRQCVCW